MLTDTFKNSGGKEVNTKKKKQFQKRRYYRIDGEAY